MAVFKIKNFSGGLDQSADDSVLAANPGKNPNSRSRDAQNVEVSDGALRTARGFGLYATAAVPAPVTRLMKFFRNDTASGSVTSYLLAATANAVYYLNGDAWTQLAGNMNGGDWDYINYQINETDVIILGNGADGMKKWDGTNFAALGGTPPNAKSLTVHAERLWATGVKSDPNTVYYSDDLNPENWTGGTDASGEIYLPTWDGGVCIGVSNIFSDLVIFKTNGIFRVLGTYPSVYEVRQVYSSVGAIAEKTIVSAADRAYFLSKEGLYYYNGVSAFPLLGDKAKEIKINPAYAEKAVSIVYKNVLYCAFPEGESSANNAVFVFDTLSGVLTLLRGFEVSDFLEYDGKLLLTGSDGFVYAMGENETGYGSDKIRAHWETPWEDCGAFRVEKTADTLYFFAKGHGALRVTLFFDRKSKSKTVVLSRDGKLHTLPFSMEGRRFKLRFENVDGSDFVLTAPELTYEGDED